MTKTNDHIIKLRAKWVEIAVKAQAAQYCPAPSFRKMWRDAEKAAWDKYVEASKLND